LDRGPALGGGLGSAESGRDRSGLMMRMLILPIAIGLCKRVVGNFFRPMGRPW